MSWLKTLEGYVDCNRIETVKRSDFVFNNKYRLLLVTYSGDVLIFDEYDTKEECEKAIEDLVMKLLDCTD